MNDFDKLVGEQLETMDELLKLQAHLEKYQQIEMSEKDTCDKKELHFIRQEIYRTELALKLLHEKFEEQTNSVIQSFETEKIISSLG
ncbi:YgaB family protein [Bacillus mobilis]|uniref:Stress-induced protein n=2 Tax=Bacillus cereus group TaxID=86661 RepID=A0A1C3ZM59_BACCE|nr:MULTISPECIES: YgaB family protein [Bacillus cereus group]MCC2460500.1 stress-induced protein [Bacillus mobilis]MCU5433399.1 stress-induced protein [Bacillus mobilis]MCU5594133.1 stress-induced protein [Bacillus mobilis]MCU5738494.1 stress-induced protein [Bacillus mobilis]MCU9558626.1 stress-induced protein [Bacillus mobilis]